MQNNYNQKVYPDQEKLYFLDDEDKAGQKRDWKGKKQNSLKLADSLKRISRSNPDYISFNYNKQSENVRHCGDLLEFKKFEDNTRKLHRANFCKYRLCPMCSWRKSLKNFGIASQVMQIARTEGYRFIFLTLTLRNVPGFQLKNEISRFLHSWNLLRHDRTVKRIVYGWIRTLEVTHNLNKDSQFYDTYNPHIHGILAVQPSYFKDFRKQTKTYIKKEQWQKLWREKAGADYDPIIDIQVVREKLKKDGGINEISKYAVKSNEMIFDNQALMDKTVQILDEALYQRRLIEYGGRLRQIKSNLNTDEDDLVNTQDEVELDKELAYIIEKYCWHSGYNNYVKL